MRILENIQSICPLCHKEGIIQKIDASIIEENNKILIVKNCQKHGSFKEIYFSDVELYKKWMQYKVTGDPVQCVKTSVLNDPKLYEEHLSQTILTNLVVTTRCNQKCTYCNIKASDVDYVYEPSLSQLRGLMKQTRTDQPLGSKAIQITGGEPTLRDDLFDIIQIARDVGFSHIQIHTDGLKLAENIEYCQHLKDEKVNTIHLSFNGVTKSTNELIEENKKAIENLRKANLNVCLVPVMIGNKNIHEAGKIVRFAFKNIDIVRGVHFQPISFCGRANNVNDDERNHQRVEYTIIIDKIEKEFKGLISRNDFYPSCISYTILHLIETISHEPQVKFSLHPCCGGSTFVVEHEGKPLPLTRFFNIETYIKFHKQQAKKKGPMKKLRLFAAVVKNMDYFTNNEKTPPWFDLKQIFKDSMVFGSQYALRKFYRKSLIIGFMGYQDSWNFNIDRLKRCVIHCPTFEGLIPLCSYIGLGYGEKIHKQYAISNKKKKNN